MGRAVNGIENTSAATSLLRLIVGALWVLIRSNKRLTCTGDFCPSTAAILAAHPYLIARREPNASPIAPSRVNSCFRRKGVSASVRKVNSPGFHGGTVQASTVSGIGTIRLNAEENLYRGRTRYID